MNKSNLKKDSFYLETGHDADDIMRHSCEHVLAAAIMSLWPNARRGVGPAIENGFYQDIEISDFQITPDDLPKIETLMDQLKERKIKFIKYMKSIEEAIILERKQGQNYKIEILEQLRAEGEKEVTYYQTGDYNDLCRGPHVDDTSQIGFFKLDRLAGAYWRGDEKRPMLQRIYGLCFSTKGELDNYLWQLEEAKKRDHKILGKQLDLYLISETIGKGLPLLTPKGTLIRKQILDYEYELEKEYGFQQVATPHIARSEIYKKTGHWQHYRDLMYDSFGIEGEEYVLKPMNCPHHYMIYASRQRSYKDLPMRLSEPGTCYRFEKTGELSGLVRVRSLTIDDSHILMTEDQIEDEFKRCTALVAKMFNAFKLKDYYVRLSLSDPSDALKYIADENIWNKAKIKLEKIVKDNNLKYKIAKGEASFYGPKLDYMVKDSIGRDWQMSTLQLDLFMGKKLNLIYIDQDGTKKHPVILHRGLTGSLERTLAILIEHFAGAFPLWLAPVQVKIIPISDRHVKYALYIYQFLSSQNIRAELNDQKESMQAKIRDATLQKVPYIGIIGDREIEKVRSQKLALSEAEEPKVKNYNDLIISIRTREGKDLGQISLPDFLIKLNSEIEKRI